MGRFMKFEKMITPVFIQIIFWVGFLGSILSGFVMMGIGILSSSGGFIQVLTGLIVLFLGPIIIRIYCEMLIVVFKMQGALVEIRDILSEKQAKPAKQEKTTDKELDNLINS